MVPIDVKIAVLRATRQLKALQTVYLSFPMIVPLVEDRTAMLESQFKNIIQTLSHLSYFADQKRKAIGPAT